MRLSVHLAGHGAREVLIIKRAEGSRQRYGDVAGATDLVGDSVVKLLVTSANDVHPVFNLGRYIRAGGVRS